MSASKDEMERAFVALLQRLKPTATTAGHFPAIADGVWAHKQGGVEQEIAKLSEKLEEQNRTKFNFMKMRANSEISADELELAKSELEVQTFAIQEKLENAMSRRAEAQAFVRFAELHLVDIAELWMKAEPEQKVRVQRLLFGDVLSYGQETGFFEPPNMTLFSILADMNTENVKLVGPPGLEPGTNGL